MSSTRPYWYIAVFHFVIIIIISIILLLLLLLYYYYYFTCGFPIFLIMKCLSAALRTNILFNYLFLSNFVSYYSLQ